MEVIISNIVTEKEEKKKIRRSNHVINASDEKSLTVTSQKLLIYLFGAVDRNKPNERTIVSLREFYDTSKMTSNQYRDADKAIDALSKARIAFRKGKYGEKFQSKYIPLFSEIGMNGGEAFFQFNNRFTELLTPSVNFTEYLYQNIHSMRSSFSVRIYELLRQGADKYRSREFAVSELKEILGIAEVTTYKKFNMFRQRVLDVACREINEFSDLIVEWEISKKTGKAISHIVFKMEEKAKTTIEVSQTKALKVSESIQSEIGFETSESSRRTSVNLSEKALRLEERLLGLGIAKTKARKAILYYEQHPEWGIWKKINEVKLAYRDGLIKNKKAVMMTYLKEFDL